MKRILVAINFSQQSPQIIKYALKLSQHFVSDVDFAYILPETSFELSDENVTDSMIKIKLEKAEKELESYIKKFYNKQYQSIIVRTYVKIGDPVSELTKLAIGNSCELLVLGKTFRNKLLFFQDTSEGLITNCPCPILTIPRNAEYQRISKILYTSNFLLEDCAAIFELQKWIKSYQAKLLCINLQKEEKLLSSANRKMNILARLFPSNYISFRCFVASDENAIGRYAKFSEVKLICTMYKDKSMMDRILGTSQKQTQENTSNIPVLTFHQNMKWYSDTSSEQKI